MKETRRRPLSQTFTNFLLPKDLRDEPPQQQPKATREEKSRRRFSLFVKVDEEDSETDSSLISPLTESLINYSNSSIDEVDEEPPLKNKVTPLKHSPPINKVLPPTLTKPQSPKKEKRLSVTSRTSLSNIMEFFTQINYGDLEMKVETETEDELIKMFNGPGDYNINMVANVMIMGYERDDKLGLDDVDLVFGDNYHEAICVD